MTLKAAAFIAKVCCISLCCLQLIGLEEDCLAPYECCDNDWFGLDRFSIGVEGLYWRATEDNLGFARKVREDESVNFDNFTRFALLRSKKEEFNHKLKPGIRLRLDYQMPCETWDVDFVWTHLLSHTSRRVSAPNLSLPLPTPDVSDVSANLLTSTFLPDSSFNVFGNRSYNQIQGGWRMNFNNFDWTLGKTIEVSCCFNLRPFAGFQVTEIAQRLHLNYLKNLDPNLPLESFGFINQRIKTRFGGVGFRGGFDTNWCFGYGFALYSKLAGAIVYGRSHTKESVIENVITPGIEAAFIESRYRDTFHAARPIIDLALGLRFDHCFCNCYYVTLKAGWEYHHFFDQNLFRKAQNDDPARGDLALHGVTFGAEVQF